MDIYVTFVTDHDFVTGAFKRIDYIRFVKRMTGILLLVIYLFTATEAKQLLKLPLLFEHYAEHKLHNNSMSFAEFICMHYNGQVANDSNRGRDHQLPFKSNLMTMPDIPASAPNGLTIERKPVTDLLHSPVLAWTDHFESPSLSSIWQPPKAC